MFGLNTAERQIELACAGAAINPDRPQPPGRAADLSLGAVALLCL
jgi:hypothetical protein